MPSSALPPLAGLRIVIVADKAQPPAVVDGFLWKVYSAFSDYALKNPFYDLDMPLRSPLFDKEIENIFSDFLRQ